MGWRRGKDKGTSKASSRKGSNGSKQKRSFFRCLGLMFHVSHQPSAMLTFSAITCKHSAPGLDSFLAVPRRRYPYPVMSMCDLIRKGGDGCLCIVCLTPKSPVPNYIPGLPRIGSFYKERPREQTQEHRESMWSLVIPASLLRGTRCSFVCHVNTNLRPHRLVASPCIRHHLRTRFQPHTARPINESHHGVEGAGRYVKLRTIGRLEISTSISEDKNRRLHPLNGWGIFHQLTNTYSVQ